MHSQIRELELAWAAGFFDGEGSTILGKQRPGKGKPFVKISISQKDRKVLDRFRRSMQVGKVYGPYENGASYHYVALGWKAEHALDLMWPYLGSIKKTQAAIVFDTVEKARGILL